MDKNIKNKLKKIKLLVLDFDGVMTDGHVYVDQDGREMVRCSRKDGMGIGLLKKAGIEALVISMEANPVVTTRCQKLKIPCWQKIETGDDKLTLLKRIVKEKGSIPEEIVYMGDDVNDLEALKYAGVAFSVADGHQSVKKAADYVTKARGGEHAVREVCELILVARGIKPKI